MFKKDGKTLGIETWIFKAMIQKIEVFKYKKTLVFPLLITVFYTPKEEIWDI